MKITPILWTQYPKNAPKNTEFPIKIRVQLGKKRLLFPLGVKATKHQWNKRDGRVFVDKRINGTDINIQILKKCQEIENNFLKGNSLAQEGSSDDFYEHFARWLDHSKLKHSEHHYKKVKVILAKLQEFRPSLKISELNHEFLRQYEAWLIKEKGNSTNTIFDNFTRIKTVVAHLAKTGLIDYHKNPFLTFKLEKKRVHRKRISYEDVLRLGAAKFKGNEQLAVDMFLFSFYCAGIRFGDLWRLSKKNFKGDRLVYTMQKTNRQRNIKLMPQALKLAEKWNYNFAGKTRYSSLGSANANLDRFLKLACKSLEIAAISFHCSRHSFADYSVKMKMPSHTMKNLLGHTKIQTTEAYMKDFYEEETDEAMHTLFG